MNYYYFTFVVFLLLVIYYIIVQVFIGENQDFGFVWYLNVGTSLVITMIMNIAAINFYKYLQWISYKVMIFLDHFSPLDHQTCGKGNQYEENGASSWYASDSGDIIHRITNKTTQIQLDQLFEGPLFVIYDRYASLVNTFFVCIIYSPGLPFLIIVLFFTFFITYLIDKHTLLRIYKLPKALDSSVAITTTKSLKYAVYIHLFIAMWMFSNPKLFSTKKQERIEFLEYSDAYISFQSMLNATSSSSSMYLNDQNEDHGLKGIYKLIDKIGLNKIQIFNRLWFLFDNINIYLIIIFFLISTSIFMKILPLLLYWFEIPKCLSKMGFKISTKSNHHGIQKIGKDIMKRNTARKTQLAQMLHQPPISILTSPQNMESTSVVELKQKDTNLQKEEKNDVANEYKQDEDITHNPQTLPSVINLPHPIITQPRPTTLDRMHEISPDKISSEIRASQYHRMNVMSPSNNSQDNEPQSFLDPNTMSSNHDGSSSREEAFKGRHSSSKKWMQFGQWYNQAIHAPGLDALSTVSWHDSGTGEQHSCMHSKLRNHAAYGHR